MPPKLVLAVEKSYRWLRLKLLNAYFGNPAKNLRVIAITGTNGKTTTLNFINQILKRASYKTAMFTTAVVEIDGVARVNDLNATIPTTAELQRFFIDAKKSQADFVLLEATSHALTQQKFPKFDLEAAIFTNLTQDHLDYHHSMEEYAFAKSKLWRMKPRFSILNIDDPRYEYFAQFNPREKRVTYGVSHAADIQIAKVTLYKKGSEIKLKLEDDIEPETIDVVTALAGKYNVYNVAAAVALAKALNINNEDIINGIADLESIPGRLERVENKLGLDIIIDYAHTPDALEKLLEYAQSVTDGQVNLVFGATGDRDKAKRPIMGKIAAAKADRIFITDEESYNEDPTSIRKMILHGVNETEAGSIKTIEIADRKNAIRAALEIADLGDAVLITGMGHEHHRIVGGERILWNDAEAVEEILSEISP